jgi:lipopolysaccharide/colanic/teichoic acid biosynthesis glycosyltransferase
VLWPLLLLVALAIKVFSPGPVLFTQWRSGLGGRPFRIYKFRTMVPDADRIKDTLLSKNEQDGPAFKMKRDPRVTRIGRILRVTSLDELPQLWNVLKGDMSLVGPRPLPLSESQACDTWHRRRMDVVPGLTCTWQISARGSVSFAEWVRMDRNYIRRRSLFHDVKLLALTVPAVLARRGAK